MAIDCNIQCLLLCVPVLALQRLRIRQIEVEHEVVVAACDVLRAFKCPRSDEKNCPTTLKQWRTNHELSFGWHHFPSNEQRRSVWTHSCSFDGK